LAGGVPGWLVAIFVVLPGLAFGSFLNVCITRLPRHESIARPRSRCPRCRAAIGARDNVPLLSWLLLRGCCRACGWRIPWRYPAVEAATTALFLLCFLRFGLTLESAGMAILCFLLLGLAVMDAETMRLPDAFTWTGIGLGVMYSGVLFEAFRRAPGAFLLPEPSTFAIMAHGGFVITSRWPSGLVAIALSAIWSLLAALMILVIRGIYSLIRHKEGLGLGDAKLLAMIAAWLGPAMTLLTLFLGVLVAAVVGVFWIFVRGRRGAMTMRLPFGSFLCMAAIYAVFAGRPILEWYLRFFR
jgi:leader peptidase (prepilin peptidase) / N-methyltransferase